MTTQKTNIMNADQKLDKLETLLESYFAASPKKWTADNKEHTQYYVLSTGSKDAQMTLTKFSTIFLREPFKYMRNVSNDPDKCFETLKQIISADDHVMIDRVAENDRAKQEQESLDSI